MSERKLIFSRKGLDSSFGGHPSLVINQRECLSFPIPSRHDKDRYEQLRYKGVRLSKIFSDLGVWPEVQGQSLANCHLDPDLYRKLKPRPWGWRASLGQHGGALTHLQNHQVGVGDIFLFFGWFRFAQVKRGKYTFLRKLPPGFEHFRNDLQVCFGYLEVGAVYDAPFLNIPSYLSDHPHLKYKELNNRIYVATPRLSLSPDLKGAGVIPFTERSILTKAGCSRSRWDLPENVFKGLAISHHTKSSWKDEYFQSANIGQEFVVSETNKNVWSWFLSLIGQKR